MKVVLVPSETEPDAAVMADLSLNSLLEFQPEIWGLPPFDDWVDNALAVDPIYLEGQLVDGFVAEFRDYDQKMLLPFLRSSQHYTLEKAYEICVKKGFPKEQAFILGRMGNTKQALTVIINDLGDMEEALEFTSMQNDDDIWEELIKQSTQRPGMTGRLLEHTVSNLDPLHIANVVPDGVEIPRSHQRIPSLGRGRCLHSQRTRFKTRQPLYIPANTTLPYPS